MRILFLLIPLLCLAFNVSANATPVLTPKTAGIIQSILEDSVNRGETLCAVGGVVTADGRWVYGTGKTSRKSGSEPDGNTIFEIGSLSKVFLDLLLEQEVLEGKISLTDPAVKYLPSDMPFPKLRKATNYNFGSDRKPRQVTLFHLATHTSGFPMMPAKADLPKSWNPEDPANVTLEMVREFFKRFVFTSDPGTEYEYSNINTGLLGYLLSLREGISLDKLLNKKIMSPLGLKDTVITLNASQKNRLAVGYTGLGKEAPPLHTPIPFSGGGSLYSTVNDLLKFTAQNLGLAPSSLQKAMAKELELVPPGDDGPPRSICYFYYPQPIGDVFLIRSRTLGFRGCMGFIPSLKIGVVILGNSMNFDTPTVFQGILEAVLGQKIRGKKVFQPVD